MTRRLLLLNGLAIIAVVVNHSAHRAPLAMFWWTFRYDPGAAAPNYDQFGSLTYYILIALIKLSYFAIPAFLFVSGFFISFVSRSQKSPRNWKTVRATITRLLVPYLIWTLVTFLINWLQSCLQDCTALPFGQYIQILLAGTAQDPYWYVLLIIQCYLLSPLLTTFAKTHLKSLLLISGLFHLSAIALIYLRMFVDVPSIVNRIFTEGRLFPRDIIYFVFGIAVGFHVNTVKKWLARFKYYLIVALVISAVLSLVEAEMIYRILGGGNNYLLHIRGGNTTVPMTLYAFLFILSFLALERIKYPFSRNLYQLGSKSYGIYLLHPFLILLIPKILYHLPSWLLEYQILYQSVLITVSLGVPVFFMALISHSRLRTLYRFLFG